MMTAQQKALEAAVSAYEKVTEVRAQKREDLRSAIRVAAQDGMTKMEIHRISGYSRPTIDKILIEQDTQGETPA